MPSASYRGKRTAPAVHHSDRKSQNKRGGNTAVRLLFFPVLFVYLELVLHIYMGAPLAYLPVYVVFGLAGGCVLTALTIPFRRQVNSVLSKVLTFLISLVYIVEVIAKIILQSYYPASSLGTAAENKLTDYSEVIVSTVVGHIPLILIFLLPFILLMIFGRRYMDFKRHDLKMVGMTLAAALVLHILGLGVIHLPWKGDLTPNMLYHMNTNIDDQVDQLGLLNMLRLDIKHQIIPARGITDDDFSNIGDVSANVDDSGSTSGSEDPGETVVDRSPNMMDVDLTALAESTSNEDIKWLANFFNSVTPTNKNEYTGMFEGYNVIMLCLEGFSGYAIDPELTPTLYKLSHEGFVFNNFYTPLHFTSTSNGECQTLLGLYPNNGFPITMKRTGELGTNAYFSLAQQLKRQGYKVMGYHGNGDMYGRLASHTNLGYDWRQGGAGFDLEMTSGGNACWPQRDSYVIEHSVNDYIYSTTPFHVYYMTISGHMPYSANWAVKPYLDTIRTLPYSEVTQNYIGTAMEVDKALETLINRLEEAGQLDKTLIVAAADHIPYFDIATLEELTGKTFGSSKAMEHLDEKQIDFDVYKNTLFMWSPSIKEPIVVDKVCGQVDILPTVSNLLGLEYDSRMLAGRDILSDSEGMVIFTSRCWKSDKGFYNRYTQTFTPASGVTMTPEEQEKYVSSMKKLVGYKLESTAKIVENDFYNVAFGSETKMP